ncbi:MAG: hypothetical protein KDC66_17645 [Phaeodactylibacter sp.]|nr:hypothetical protein [Phaeodactylibacter sp.]MCB9275315.1 hypothetical protein [Lewinellaceae bacterium]
MNVFILCSGRSGSTTFIRACQHIDNFSAGHETRPALLGEERLDFPDNHIEADNRLSWMLGKLGKKYGKDAFYVHLRRDVEPTAVSFNRRWDYPGSLIRAYTKGILMAGEQRGLKYCRDMLETIHYNIEYFLRDKPNQMTIHLETISQDFPRFWQWIGAEGDLDAAMHQWEIRYNQSKKLGIFGRMAGRIKGQKQ